MNRYKDIKTLSNSEGFNYRRNIIFPEIKESLKDIYVITTAGDRFDTLACQEHVFEILAPGWPRIEAPRAK